MEKIISCQERAEQAEYKLREAMAKKIGMSAEDWAKTWGSNAGFIAGYRQALMEQPDPERTILVTASQLAQAWEKAREQTQAEMNLVPVGWHIGAVAYLFKKMLRELGL